MNKCVAFSGDPSPEVTWWRGTALLDDTYNVTPQGFVRNELFLFELRRSDLLAEFTCQATNTNLTKPKTTAVRVDINCKNLRVKYLHSLHNMHLYVNKSSDC